MKTWQLDTNVILRFLRNDDATQSPQAKALFARAKAGRLGLRLSVLTVAEVFYALRASYKLSRPTAAGLLLEFVQTGVTDTEACDVVTDALRRVVSANVDFGDAMLAASAVHDAEGVASFDGDFDRFPDVTLYRWTT